MEVQCVAFAKKIVKRYYVYLHHNRPDLLVALYRPRSRIARLENGVIAQRASTMQEIGALVMTWNYSDLKGSITIDNNDDTTSSSDAADNANPSDEPIATATFPPGRTVDINNDPISLRNVAESVVTSKELWMELDSLLESDSPDNARILDESVATDLPSYRTIDTNNDPISFSKVAESEITSQGVLMEFDYLLKDSMDIAHLLVESITTALLCNIAESEKTSQQALMELDDLLKSDSLDNAHPSYESIATILPPDQTTDNNNDPISLSSVADCVTSWPESEITSQLEPDFDDLLESDTSDNSHTSDESSTSVEIDSLDSFPNHYANEMRSKPCKKSLVDIEGVFTVDQDQEQRNPKYVNRVLLLPDAGDTDLESLTTLANEMSIQPRANGF